MALLDSLLAFALTLAVLATVVTLLQEVIIRFLGRKRKGQVRIIKELLDGTVADYLPKETDRWVAVKKILQNPFAVKKMADTFDAQTYVGTAASGIYGDVSLEHLLRRLLETDVARSLVSETREKLKPKLQRIAQKYDEYSSAVSVEFKRKAQLWSIGIGVVLAFAMNIDGLRVLEAYLQDPALRQSVIEQLAIPDREEAAPDEEQSVEDTNQGDGNGSDALKKDTGNTPSGTTGHDNPQANGKDTDDGNGQNDRDADEVINDLKAQLAQINDLALPIGTSYFPHCHLPWKSQSAGSSADPLCKSSRSQVPHPEWLLWFLKVLVTGLLIGLGAPFWYDVARRLAAIRTVFGGKGSGEEQHRGADPTGEAEQRDKLIDRIAEDAKAAADGQSASNPQPSPGGQPQPSAG